MRVFTKQFFIKSCKISLSILALLVVISTWLLIDCDMTGDWEGLYLVSGPGNHLTLTDDLFPEDNLVAGMAFTWISKAVIAESCSASTGSCISSKWDEKNGRGYVKNFYQDGRKLLINLSRFKNENGELSSGIFLGGGLPPGDPDYSSTDKDDTGMSYYDGRRWYHIWCSVNEAVLSSALNSKPIYPQQWNFLNSRVLENSSNNISIVSHHWFSMDGVPFFVEKLFFYESGDNYFTLVTKIKNEGVRPMSLYYLYGDEPWVGHYGTAMGNVGWTKDGFFKTEGEIDTTANTIAGILDYGNDLAGEAHTYTGMANFIEWDRTTRPDLAYFSNVAGRYTKLQGISRPLADADCRFLGLEWARTLKPAESMSFTLAIGMANNNPQNGLPFTPVTRLN